MTETVPENRLQDVSNFASRNSPQPQSALIVDGKKFLWDGLRYTADDDARRQVEKYKNDNFEIRLVEDNGSYLIYTRRMVKEVTETAP
jgi:hypothetical protein